MVGPGRRSVTTPAGDEWRIGRRWISRGLPRWRKVRIGKPRAGDVAEAAWWSISPPDLGDVAALDDFAAAIALVVAAVVVAVVLIPLLLFGIELIIVGFVIAAGILARGLLGRPWVVQATPVGSASESLIWRVPGWRRSGRLIDEVAASLTNGLKPEPAEAAELISAAPWASARRADG
jgi:hypothetical protein